jgi:hypothetical protein
MPSGFLLLRRDSRPFFKPCTKLLKLFRATGGNEFHRAVFVIADPAY